MLWAWFAVRHLSHRDADGIAIHAFNKMCFVSGVLQAPQQ